MEAHVLASAATDKNLELVLDVLPALIVILVTSGLCGWLMRWVWQPRVLGEMVAGVLLGPTLFGWLFPDAQKAVFPPEVKPILYVISTIGLTLYMFLVGAGLDHGGEERDGAHRPIILAISGIFPALILGAGVGWALWSTLSGGDVSRWLFAVFLGGALSLTAFPMLARILYERGLQNSRLGRLTIMAASIDDAAAWCLLAVLSAVHLGDGTGSAMRTIALALLFVTVALVVVRPLLRPLGRAVARAGDLGLGHTYVVLVVPLAAGWMTDWIGIYSVFGGFIAGLAMPRDSVFRRLVHERMMNVVSVLLLPVFFTFSGLNTQLGGLTGGTMLMSFLAILTAAFIGKYFGCALAMRTLGFGNREAYAVGGLMNARGLMILIFINIGLAQGIISRDVFSMLVLVAVITTAAAMPLYSLALPRRLEKEQVPAAPEPEKAAAAA
ncbi:cation:proton antiporter [Actinomadura chokoriensis]|uniref:Cation:proton antiporter n=1 Tax=Actinomadura chokoriensis TaxID=454156 RepID=A0ABV4R2G0_9ACTN